MNERFKQQGEKRVLGKNLKQKNNLFGLNKSFPHLRKQNQLNWIKLSPVRIESRKLIYISLEEWLPSRKL